MNENTGTHVAASRTVTVSTEALVTPMFEEAAAENSYSEDTHELNELPEYVPAASSDPLNSSTDSDSSASGSDGTVHGV